MPLNLASDQVLWAGGLLTNGKVALLPASSPTKQDEAKATAILSGGDPTGSLLLRGLKGEDRINLDAGAGNIWLGGNGQNGNLVMFSANGDNKTVGQATINLDGDRGDIILQNADCAEEFDTAEPDAVEAGTVMVLDQDGALRSSTLAYDKRVAGVVSGAGDYKPGIVLGRKPSLSKRLPVALVGKVFCKVDAEYSPVEVGDLLTTSPTPGHAMRATDALRAFGSVIGKALRPIQEGTGLIPILIALQ